MKITYSSFYQETLVGSKVLIGKIEINTTSFYKVSLVGKTTLIIITFDKDTLVGSKTDTKDTLVGKWETIITSLEKDIW